MSKHPVILLLIVYLSCVSAFAQKQRDINVDNENVQKLAATFTKRLLETLDYKAVVDDLYMKDFIERYTNNKIQQATRDHLATVEDFAPGLNYDVSLLKQANVEDWRRFYIATNNFLLSIQTEIG